MRTIEEKIYNYDELSEEVKERLLEKQKERELESYCEYCLIEDMRYKARELVKEYFNGATFNNVYYDLSYCQGSGAMIEFTINIVDLNNKYHILSDEELRYVTDKGIVNDIVIYHKDNLYYHEYTFDIKYYDDFYGYDYEDIKDEYNITEEEFNTIEDRIIKLLDAYNKHNTESEFIKDIVSMNKELTKYGYSVIEHPIDDEIALESLRENEYYENGEIF